MNAPSYQQKSFSSPSIQGIDELLEAIEKGTALEYLHTNLELKEDWNQKHGSKLSALANKLDQISSFVVVGVRDNGVLAGKSESWAKEKESIISQHANLYLDPVQACKGIFCKRIRNSWVVIILLQNPGEVTYWDMRAYCAAGSTLQELGPQEILKLRIQLPGLIDYSNQHQKANYQQDLVRRFANDVRDKGHHIEASFSDDPIEALKILSLNERQAARILFGRPCYRYVKYDQNGDPIKNQTISGLFSLLLPENIEQIAGRNDESYSRRALKEALANAVAHAAYFEADGDLIVEQFEDRITISNLCLSESAYFANLWFSRGHKTVNGLLMECLRVAGFVDELGRGKNLIFSESIKYGRKPPEVLIENAGKYKRWKLTLFGGTKDQKRLKILNRCREVYNDERKALIAVALVLWSDLKVSQMRQCVDTEFTRQFADVLTSVNGPIIYSQDEDKVVLRRWVEILFKEGKDSKILSPEEENQLRILAYDRQSSNGLGYVKLADLRELGAMGNSASEKTLSHSIMKNWMSQKRAVRLSKGKYKVEPPETLRSVKVIFEDLLNSWEAKDLSKIKITIGPQG